MESCLHSVLIIEFFRGLAEASMEQMNKENSYRACGFLEGA